MRIPNAKCCICGKPLHRKPKELANIRYVACMDHRNEAQKRAGQTAAQIAALSLGRKPGTNHLSGHRHNEDSKRKMSESQKQWCTKNPDKVKARGEKVRGPNHYNWKGGLAKFASSVRQMTENRKWMDDVVLRDGMCQRCSSDTDLEAHHIRSFSSMLKEHHIETRQQARDCLVLWDLANGLTLCKKCHYKHHGRAYSPTGNGRRKNPRKIRQSMAGKSNPNYRGGKVPLICTRCGTTFHVKRATVNKRKHCSRRCCNEDRRKNVQGHASRVEGHVL